MAKPKGMNSHTIKNNNRGLALQCIMQGQATSRGDIAKGTGLTKMTVSNIVTELMADGYIVEKEEHKLDTRGRNPVGLDLSPDAPKIVSLYIGRRVVEVAITNLKCEALYAKHLPVSEETALTLEKKILYLLDNAFKHVKSRVLGISVSAVGLVDQTGGRLITPLPYFDMDSFDLVSLLTGRYGLHTAINNDMNNAALLENLFGAGLRYRNFAYLGITTGIGMGIIANGLLYQGDNGFAGEIAHMSIDYNGNPCACGNRGCLETYVCMPVLYERLMAATGLSKIDFLDFEEISHIPAADAVFRDTVEKLAHGLVNVVNLLDLKAIVERHEGAHLSPRYVRLLEERLNARVIGAGHQRVAVETTAYTDEWVPYRAAASIADEVFRGRLY